MDAWATSECVSQSAITILPASSYSTERTKHGRGFPGRVKKARAAGPRRGGLLRARRPLTPADAGRLRQAMLSVDAWWDEPEYKTCNTLHLRGLFILRQLREHDPAKFQDVMTDLYRDDQPDPQDIGKFEWQTILAFMGASDEEIKDVQMRMGRPWQ